jgi:hypothetical protein
MLKFSLKAIEPILAHSEAATTHGKCYDIDGTDKPGLWFVKDSGVYLMSNGQPRQIDPEGDGERSLVAYAKGHNPTVDGNTWDADRAECGGDDFGEFIEAAFFRKAINEGRAQIIIRIRAKSFSLEAR